MPKNGLCPYQTFVSASLYSKIQAKAVELYSKGELCDEDGTPVELRVNSAGAKRFSRYVLTRIALAQFANGREHSKRLPTDVRSHEAL